MIRLILFERKSTQQNNFKIHAVYVRASTYSKTAWTYRRPPGLVSLCCTLLIVHPVQFVGALQEEQCLYLHHGLLSNFAWGSQPRVLLCRHWLSRRSAFYSELLKWCAKLGGTFYILWMHVHTDTHSSMHLE